MKKLPLTYYQNPDVVFLAKDLIGKYLFTHIDGNFCGGIITETEAYNGNYDKACHAYGNRKTKRTRIMYEAGGLAYVYLCYGIHNLFNIVTNQSGLADAILIRSIEPTHGIEYMLKRRNKTLLSKSLTSGPGSLSQALGISLTHYGEDLTANKIWLAQNDSQIPEDEIRACPRIGVDYAGEDARLPWRFYWKKTDFISKK